MLGEEIQAETIKELRAEVRSLKDRATRSEHKASLAQREISFLQAMVVSTVPVCVLWAMFDFRTG